MVSVTLDLASTVVCGKGYWKLNSLVLVDPNFKETFTTFYNDQRTTQCMYDDTVECGSARKVTSSSL